MIYRFLIQPSPVGEGGSRRLTDEVYFCKRNFGYRGVFQAPLCKGSCRRKPTEGLFFTTLPPLSRSRTPLGEACKHAPHTCKPLPHKRGLIKIKSRLCRSASLRSSLFSFISKSPAEAGLFVLQIFRKVFVDCGAESCERS